MSRAVWLSIAVLALSGCRIVSQQELAALKNPPNAKMADVHQVFEQKIVPQLVAGAQPLDELMKNLAVAKDFATACQQFGYRTQVENPCIFSVALQGTVEQVNTTSRSGKLTLKDVSGRSVVVQIGPIIRGTALRDAYKDASYQDFNDQALFGDYGRAINNQASDHLKALQPKVGDRLAVVGVFSSWDIPQTVPDITPARVTRQ